jgi:predicted HTH transcriptional regulator
MINQEFIEWIEHGREERNIEYKGDISWEDAKVKAIITKSILAMCNIKDGGVIVIGIHKNGEIYEPNGLTKTNYDSFKQDDVSAYVNEFADPYVEITLRQIEYNSKYFIIIQIFEFSELPVICKKDGSKNLKRGGIYTRPRRKIESTLVPGQVEMREIIDIAVSKNYIIQSRKCKEIGLEASALESQSKSKFDDQLKDL